MRNSDRKRKTKERWVLKHIKNQKGSTGISRVQGRKKRGRRHKPQAAENLLKSTDNRLPRKLDRMKRGTNRMRKENSCSVSWRDIGNAENKEPARYHFETKEIIKGNN